MSRLDPDLDPNLTALAAVEGIVAAFRAARAACDEMERTLDTGDDGAQAAAVERLNTALGEGLASAVVLEEARQALSQSRGAPSAADLLPHEG